MQALERHLTPLRRSRLISSWHDGCIIPGEEWEKQVKENLEKAQIILLLISVDFINSDFCYDVELTRAIERYQAKQARVIPVILKHCDWEETPVGSIYLGDLQALPTDAKPIEDKYWENQDKAFTDIAKGIRKVIRQLQDEKTSIGVAERAKRKEEAQQQQVESERQQKREEYFNGGTYHLEQGNYDQAIADFEQAKQHGHPDAERYLATARQQQAAAADDLSSEKGIDYRKLRDLLIAGKWKEADYETYLCMVKAVGREDGDWIRADELRRFPCADLLTIDCLWVKYSNGQFGFSVQKQIYVECGGQLDAEYPGAKIWEQFAEKVGWLVNGSYISYSEVIFSTSAARGHLPVRFGGVWGVFVGVRWGVLFSRIKTCRV